MLEMRPFGRTGMHLSILGFGCGAVGGLMVRGDPLDQERTIAQALAAGVNYFDTAVQYGNGQSEKNLGRILQKLKPHNVAVGTKIRLPSADFPPYFGRGRKVTRRHLSERQGSEDRPVPHLPDRGVEQLPASRYRHSVRPRRHHGQF
jgi:aryl-alcohol dehydrogenase-like predicted oxidoreductase